MESLFQFLKAAAGMFAVMGAWVLLQSFVRRRSGCGADKDVLDFMAHGCAGCKGPGACQKRSEKGVPS